MGKFRLSWVPVVYDWVVYGRDDLAEKREMKSSGQIKSAVKMSEASSATQLKTPLVHIAFSTGIPHLKASHRTILSIPISPRDAIPFIPGGL